MPQKLLIHRRLDKNFQFQDDWTNISSPAYSQIDPVWTRCSHHDVCLLTAELRSVWCTWVQTMGLTHDDEAVRALGCRANVNLSWITVSTAFYSCKAMGWKDVVGTSLVVQWLRICLPMQGTWVWSLVGELRLLQGRANSDFMLELFHDPTCCRATKPMRHNYGLTVLNERHRCSEKPAKHN